jgi:hypothetical protein
VRFDSAPPEESYDRTRGFTWDQLYHEQRRDFLAGAADWPAEVLRDWFIRLAAGEIRFAPSAGLCPCGCGAFTGLLPFNRPDQM